MALRSASPACRRRGSALIPALFVVLLLSSLSLAYVRISIDRHRETRAFADAKRAFYLAEAGLAESFFGLATGRNGNVASDELPAAFGGGVFWVVVEDAGDGRLRLKSTGLAGGGRSSLSLVVEEANESVASLGMFGGDGLFAEAGATIDAYDSRAGGYAEQLAAGGVDGARIGSNGDVTLRGTREAPTAVRGDATPGPENAVVRDAAVTISGSTEPREEPYDLPRIDLPPVDLDGPRVERASRHPVVVPPGEHGWTTLRLESEAKLVLSGPATVVVDVLEVLPQASLTIDGAGGPVRLHVREKLDLAPGSAISSLAASPQDVALLVSASRTADRDGDGTPEPPVRLEAKGSFQGTIYAPHAAVALPAGLEVFGAAAARSLTVRAGARLHFDRALAEVGGAAEKLPHVSCWRVVELPPVEIVKSGLDPLTHLKLKGKTPKKLKDSHYPIGTAPVVNDPNVTPATVGLPNAGTEPADEGVPAEPEPPIDPVTEGLLEVCGDPGASSSELKDAILDASPVEPSVLAAAIQRTPLMSSNDLKAVLVANGPLSPPLLTALLDRATRLASNDLRDVLIASSPLPPDVFARVLTASPRYLSPGHLLALALSQ
jgi:hypothetical protein